MLNETIALLPLLQSINAEELLKKEIADNQVLSLGKAKTRERNISEIRRRYKSVPLTYWDWFAALPVESQPVALFFVLLKTYYLLLDFQLNTIVPKWRSASQVITRAEIMMRLNEIAANDGFVDSWTDATKGRICSRSICFLRCAGMLEPDTDKLRPANMRDEDFAHYIELGEGWFLEACLLQPYEIERIKRSLK